MSVGRDRYQLSATNKPFGDDARKGAVRKRSELKTAIEGEEHWTKRSKETVNSMGGDFGSDLEPQCVGCRDSSIKRTQENDPADRPGLNVAKCGLEITSNALGTICLRLRLPPSSFLSLEKFNLPFALLGACLAFVRPKVLTLLRN